VNSIRIALCLYDLKRASRGQVEDHISLVLVGIDEALNRTGGVLITSVGPILVAHVIQAINSRAPVNS
jgi:hypothetical protein